MSRLLPWLRRDVARARRNQMAEADEHEYAAIRRFLHALRCTPGPGTVAFARVDTPDDPVWVGFSTHELAGVHTATTGSTGAGKTTLCVADVLQRARDGMSLTSLDLKGDVTRTLSHTLPAVTGRPANVIQPFTGDATAPAPLRLTAAEPGVLSEAQALRIAMDIGAALNEPLSLRQVRVLAKLIQLCLELDAQQHDTPLTHVAAWLNDPAVLVRAAQRSADFSLRRFAATLQQSESRATLASLAAKLDVFLLSPFLRRALEADDCIDFGASFDAGELLLDLSAPAGTEEAAAILGALLLGRCTRSALSRPLGQRSEPATLLLDEFPEVVRAAHQREQLARLLALTRARNISCVLNFQAGSQLDRQLIDVVRSCCSIEACFRLNLTDARAYAPAFPPPTDASDESQSHGALLRRLATLQRREYLLWPKAWGMDPVFVRAPKLDFAALEARADRVLAQHELQQSPTIAARVEHPTPAPELPVVREVADDSGDDGDFLHLG